MSALTDFYDFYAPMRSKYGLRLTMSSNSKETRITIHEGRKELVKVAEEEYDLCYIRARRELEERLKKRGNSQCINTKQGDSHSEYVKDRLRQ